MVIHGVVTLLFFLFFFPGKVYAYLDPGTGSYLYQLALAGLFGGVYFLGALAKKILHKFKKKKFTADKHAYDNRQS